ncbi:A disintegrin and metalloproteinase with thrombospondin motifs 17 [Poecilia reticulata]|uniref:ADAM metallopeptidase with thrombospondin type 1 motif 17 n=1 Tax=Poecilia reticulata TaxID=8081 RepID=A0A3P9N215_POERE|nr:PREDICTED: A disintegrin and metalloproteinase with thrombospondin motifs 17 [Poecilia reticulata]
MRYRHVPPLLLCLLCIGLTAQTDVETAEVIPRLLSSQETYLSEDPAYRLRRHHQWPLDFSSKEHSEAENVIVSLSAFGRSLYLNLTRDRKILSRDFVIEERLRNQSVVVKHLSMKQLCFYSGFIINHTDSLASLSSCGGLTGLIQIGEDSLFIQPVGEYDPSQSFSGIKHQLVRHRCSPKSSTGQCASQPIHCGTAEGQKKKKKSKLGEEDRTKRNTMNLHKTYTLETVVVADFNMVQYHGAEVAQRFLLTIMNMVDSMFQHKSLGVKVNIKVNKLVLLHNRPEKLKISHHGQRSLESFCQWQHREFSVPRYLGTNHITGGRYDVPPVDTAVLVTRTDFCVHKDEPCDTVGMAYLGGACSAKRKCVLAEDNGLNLAFTIAHELGHNMGMSHDDDHANCTSHSHIMSGEWVKGRNPNNLSWSSCSSSDLQNFLRSGASMCLHYTDPSRPYRMHLSSKLPGMYYSVDEQCQILFGINSTSCPDMEHLMCAGLWCLVDGDPSCKTKLDPPLEGTECGTDKWCRGGQCVSKAPIPQHVDGDWSPWSQWSMCSRTCGTGVQFRQRKCDNPPPGPDGQHCPEASVEHKACQGQPCPKGAPSFRDLQCLSYDQHASKRKGRVLTAFINDDKPCMLFCSPVGHDVPVLMADKVIDGTSCGPYESDLCIKGSCKKIGCDGIIGSSAKEDTCGVCNGHGDSCKIVKGDFNYTKGMGYVEAVVIPAGAWRIKVMEDKPLHSFLALKDSSKRSINSDWKIELPGDFELAGTMVRYVRRGLWEKISAKGPTKTPLHLMVLLFHDQSYGIHYEYTIPVNTSQDRSNEKQTEPEYLYVWAHSSWQNCSVQCGGGERSTAVSCMRTVNNSMEAVSDKYCHPETRPQAKVQRCNTLPCQYRWVAGEWGPCSISCGNGLQQRQVSCVYSSLNGSLIHAKDRDCHGGKPVGQQDCEGNFCLPAWEASDWSQCSSACGRGVRTRTVRCRSPDGGCEPDSKPSQQEPCEEDVECFEWRFGDWSKCSSTCGKGLQSRVVQCMHKDTGRHGDNCPLMLRPPIYRSCYRESCFNRAKPADA